MQYSALHSTALQRSTLYSALQSPSAKMIFPKFSSVPAENGVPTPCPAGLRKSCVPHPKKCPESQNYILPQRCGHSASHSTAPGSRCTMSPIRLHHRLQEVVRLQNQHRRIVLLGRDFFRLYTCNLSACTCTCGCIGSLRLPHEEIVVRRVSQGAKKWCPHPKTCPRKSFLSTTCRVGRAVQLVGRRGASV